MKTITVSYSWQTDRPNNLNRSFIGDALESAVKRLNQSSQAFRITIEVLQERPR
jgi:hypothetical protein